MLSLPFWVKTLVAQTGTSLLIQGDLCLEDCNFFFPVEFINLIAISLYHKNSIISNVLKIFTILLSGGSSSWLEKKPTQQSIKHVVKWKIHQNLTSMLWPNLSYGSCYSSLLCAGETFFSSSLVLQNCASSYAEAKPILRKNCLVCQTCSWWHEYLYSLAN